MSDNNPDITSPKPKRRKINPSEWKHKHIKATKAKGKFTSHLSFYSLLLGYKSTHVGIFYKLHHFIADF